MWFLKFRLKYIEAGITPTAAVLENIKQQKDRRWKTLVAWGVLKL